MPAAAAPEFRQQSRSAKTLHRREIELAVFERAAGELARLGRPATLDLTERIEHAGDDRLAAVKLQLGHVLAGLAARRRKPQRQRFVDDSPLAGSRTRASAALRGSRHRPISFLKRNACARPGHAHHRNRRRRPAGRQGEDGGNPA